MFDLILDSVEDFHTVEERRLHRIFCGLDFFWVTLGTGNRRNFTTFQELTETKLFDGKSLRAVWADVTLTSINDFWLDEHLS